MASSAPTVTKEVIEDPEDFIGISLQQPLYPKYIRPFRNAEGEKQEIQLTATCLYQLELVDKIRRTELDFILRKAHLRRTQVGQAKQSS